MTLRDTHGRETGSLVVRLLDPFTPRADEIPATDNASDNFEPEQDVATPTPEPAQGAVEDSGVVEDSGNSILNLMRRVVGRTKAVADSVEKTPEVCVASLSSIAMPRPHQ